MLPIRNPKARGLEVRDHIVEPKGNVSEFDKRLVFEGIEDDINPQRLKNN